MPHTDQTPSAFEAVFSAELDEIRIRQGKPGGDPVDKKELAGLALSGGGIRSATTSLGALQALKKLGLLPVFDYLSTVSGGGFTGSWSAWTSRDFDANATPSDKFFPPEERTQPERDADEGAFGEVETTPDPEETAKRRAAADPVHHLRLFSNYLTPVKGLMSGDTWRAITIISRNLVLTWLVMIPILFAAVLLAQVYFTLQPDSEVEYLYPYSHIEKDKALNAKIDREITAARNLDKLVHINADQSVNPSVPLFSERELQRILVPQNQSLSDSAIGTIQSDIDSIVIDDDSDNVISAEIGEKKTFATLKNNIDSLARESREVSQLDSLHLADPARFQGLPVGTRVRDREAMDKKVDSIRRGLGEIHDAMLRNRWEERNGMLFNTEHVKYLTNRVISITYLPAALLGWIVMFVSLWMSNVSNKSVGGNVIQGTIAYVVGLMAFRILLVIFPALFGRELDLSDDTLLYMTLVWGAVALVLLNRVMWDSAHHYWKTHRRSMDRTKEQELSRLLDVRRARIVLSHERLLLVTFLVTVWLLFGGFGHEVINYMVYYRSRSTWDVDGQLLVRLASVAAILLAISGSALVARGAVPTTGGDRRDVVKPNKFKKLLMGIAPPLILVILLCSVSWVGHWILQDVVFRTEDHSNRNLITIVVLTWALAFAAIYYSIEELHFGRGLLKGRNGASRSAILRRVLYTFQIVVGILTLLILHRYEYLSEFRWVAVGISVVTWAGIFFRGRAEKKAHPEVPNELSAFAGTRSGSIRAGTARSSGRPRMLFGTVAGTSLLILIGSEIALVGGGIVLAGARMPFHWPYLMGLLVCFGVLLAEFAWGSGGNTEERYLLGGVITMCTVFLFIPSVSLDPHLGVTHVLATLVSIAVGLVVYVGWRLDPNALSIHAFYRSRIVRAYLGASNWLRGRASVSEVHGNDDLALTGMKNCEQGAPYHLVNTTLNLLGAKSLEAAQRHASNFILTKRYCGSVTTGFRPTEEYMGGEMSLGTAVAISGAAASPNMGSNQVSGAITMLMSLLNIRLGYWAPNPARKSWRHPQPKLWPYYLIMESLSKTTGLGAFCYLTDGGHFDNTGIYPLIERACRYIVLCDNGADPEMHLKDVGNAFRRCRIDFGAEFTLDGLREMTNFRPDPNAPLQHWLRGTVTYSESHLNKLWGANWDAGLTLEEKAAYQTGIILILKPTILGDEPADVLQYSLENGEFPQQSTANQWFSEDQFESYRRLGNWNVYTAFNKRNYSGAERSEMLQAIARMDSGMEVPAAPLTGAMRSNVAAGPAVEPMPGTSA